jgi:bifunctional non-homologous end joining protein LigD
MAVMNKIRVGPYTVELSKTDKVLFPDDSITKGDLINYYRRVAEIMLPHMEGRPITMHRFPDGVGKEGFYEKEAPDYFPAWIKRVSVEKREGGRENQIVCENAATLVYLADQACITPHIWLSRMDKLLFPDKMIFDLDPPDDDFEPVRSAALSLRDLLEKLGMNAYVMTTGSRGLHVVVPLDRSADFDTVRSFAQDVAKVMVRQDAELLTIEERKDKRRGRLFLDTLRNAYAQTSVAPYAIRAKRGAPVATPLDWHELNDPSLHSQSYTMRNIFHRLGQKGDPWKEIWRHAYSLSGPQKRLDLFTSKDGS